MTAPDALSGRCLCGAVRFTVQPKHREMDVCHCGMCRRWSGGALMSVECVPGITIDDEAKLGLYGSSDHGERGFCRICGSSLFWRMRDGSLLTVSAQAFDDPAQFTFATEIFIDDKPPNYAFAGSTVKKTGAEIAAMFPGLTEPSA
ncbi:GFA family protein [Methylobacterium oryzisoli]|uniref:GFA family protein n=1 Tax=Methylobacterium oryzisoli TaxID=3385502 RepID=UPI003891FB30